MKGAIFINLRRLFCSVLAFAVICCVPFSISAYAAKINYWDVDGSQLPVYPSHQEQYILLYYKDNDYKYYLEYTPEPKTVTSITDVKFDPYVGYPSYRLVDGSWESYSPIGVSGCTLVWSNYDVYSKTGDLLMTGQEPVFLSVDVPVGVSDISPVVNAFTFQIAVPMVVGILAGLAGVSVTLVFMWWGVRKVSGSLMKAFKKGKIRI